MNFAHPTGLSGTHQRPAIRKRLIKIFSCRITNETNFFFPFDYTRQFIYSAGVDYYQY